MLQAYIFMARLVCMAASRSCTSRLGSRLVYKLPGPTTMISAFKMAFITGGKAEALSGSSQTRRTLPAIVGILLSPSTRTSLSECGSSMLATSFTLCKVEGSTRPLTERTRPDSATASSKLPVRSARAVMKRFPKECPSRSGDPLKRY